MTKVSHHPAGWIRTSLLVVTALLGGTVIVVAGLALYYLNNMSALKALTRNVVAYYTHRDLQILGDLKLEVGWRPRITAESVSYSNAPWSDEPLMAQVEYLSLQIDLPALFDNRVHLVDLDIREGSLRLESTDGESNWNLISSDDESDSNWLFVLESMNLMQTTVDVDLHHFPASRYFASELKVAVDERQHLHQYGHGTLNEIPWRIDGHLGPLPAIFALRDIEHDLELTFGKSRIVSKGVLGDPLNLEGLDLEVQVSGSDASIYGDLIGIGAITQGTLELRAKITPDQPGFSFTMDGHVGEFEVSATGGAQQPLKIDGAELKFELNGPELAVINTFLHLENFPSGPFTVSAAATRAGGKLKIDRLQLEAPDVSFVAEIDLAHFPSLDDAEISIKASGNDLSRLASLLRLPALTAEPFELTATLTTDEESREHIDASVRVENHVGSIKGVVGDYPDYSNSVLDVVLEGDDVRFLTRHFTADDRLATPYKVETSVVWNGTGLEIRKSSVKTGPISLAIIADFPSVTSLIGTKASISGRATSLLELGEIYSISNLPASPVEASVDMRITDTGYNIDTGTLQMNEITFKASGTAVGLQSMAGLQLEFSMEGAPLDEILPTAIPGPEGDVPFSISSRIVGFDNKVEFSGFTYRSADSVVRADGEIGLPPDLWPLKITIDARGAGLQDILPTTDFYYPPEGSYRITGSLEFPSAELLEVADARIVLGSATVSVRGALDLGSQIHTDLDLFAEGDSFSDLGSLRAAEFPEEPFQIHAEFDGVRNRVNFTRLDLAWGDSDLNVAGFLDIAADVPTIQVRATSKHLDFTLFQPEEEEQDEEEQDDSPYFLPHDPLPFELLRKLNADIKFHADNWTGYRVIATDVALIGQLSDGALSLEKFSYSDSDGTLTMGASLLPDPAVPGQATLTVKATSDNVDLGLLVAEGQPLETRPQYDIDLSLHGSGSTIAEIAGNLNGGVLIGSEGGIVETAAFDAFFGDFLASVFNTLNPFAQTESTSRMDCTVLRAPIEDGVVRLDPGLILRTDKLNMFVKGTANLSTERLNLLFASQPRKGIGISAGTIVNPYFKVGGTFRNPALELDAQGAAIAYTAAVATGGLSIIAKGLWDRLMGERNPCLDYIKE